MLSPSWGRSPLNSSMKVIEAGLLLEEVGAGRLGGLLLERQVHAFVAPVLLRVAGLDAFDVDAEPEPPDRHFGEAPIPRFCSHQRS